MEVSGSDFRDLEVWKKARGLALDVYRLTADGPLARDFGLRDQMRRAVVSICSNIAEGNERNTDRDTVRFLYMAKGPASELMSQVDIALGVGYLGSDEAKELIGACEEVSRMLGGLNQIPGAIDMRAICVVSFLVPGASCLAPGVEFSRASRPEPRA